MKYPFECHREGLPVFPASSFSYPGEDSWTLISLESRQNSLMLLLHRFVKDGKGGFQPQESEPLELRGLLTHVALLVASHSEGSMSVLQAFQRADEFLASCLVSSDSTASAVPSSDP